MKSSVRTPGAKHVRTKAVHPIDLANAKLPPELARSRYGKWRALSLTMIYVLMAVHIMHWKVSGRTMAPLELSEIMKALELRVLSPGVIFIGVMLLGSLVFGRFFCSWGCHMLALQDLSHWVLKKLGIRPRPIRSRVLLLVPFLAAGYMFVWPQIKLAWRGTELREASSRLITTDFWRDLPGPLVIALTFLTCGFLIVYFFGGRGFCTYGCPYGVLFGLLDRLALGKIRVGAGCKQCGRCTAICTSGIRVHEETKAYGMVVHPRCMKDLDCVSVCPEHALRFRFGRPALTRSRKSKAPPVRYDFSISEEAVMVVVFVAALFTWRGLYDQLPFLMSLAASAVTAYLTITLARMFYRRDVQVNRYLLRRAGQWLRPGYAFAVAGTLFLLFAMHSGFIQYNLWRGERLMTSAGRIVERGAVEQDRRRTLLERSVEHFSLCDRYGLVSPTSLRMKLGTALLELDRAAEAESVLSTVVQRAPNYAAARIQFAGALAKNGRDSEAVENLAYALDLQPTHEEYESQFQHVYAEAHVQWGKLLADRQQLAPAEEHYRAALRLDENNLDAHFGFAVAVGLQGRLNEAAEHYRFIIALNPAAAEAHANLGDVLLALNETDKAVEQYRAALNADPDTERVRFKLGVIAWHMSNLEEASQHLAVAVEQAPGDAEAHNYYGLALERSDRPDAALRQFEQALAIDENYADAHFNLARLSELAGRRASAERHMRRAIQLDSRYESSMNPNLSSGP